MVDRVSRAERFSADRGKICLIFSLVSVIWAVVLIDQVESGQIHGITVMAWAVWVFTTSMWVFGQPGRWKWTVRERAVINDELTHEHQRSAALAALAALGLGVALGCVAVLARVTLPAWWPIAAATAGACAAGLRFSWLQLRASR
jgi:hypothetical protein